jgi:hypothetical protein
MSSNPFDPTSLSANPYERKIQNEYRFDGYKQLSSFVHSVSRNPGVTNIDLKGKDTLSVTFRSQETMNSIDSFYKESYNGEIEKKNSELGEDETKNRSQSFTNTKNIDITNALDEVGRLANQPLVKTGQGSYEKKIRPSDILKRKKKKNKR